MEFGSSEPSPPGFMVVDSMALADEEIQEREDKVNICMQSVCSWPRRNQKRSSRRRRRRRKQVVWRMSLVNPTKRRGNNKLYCDRTHEVGDVIFF